MLGVQHGLHERHGEGVPMSNLLRSTQHVAARVQGESFLDSTGFIPGLPV